MVAPADAGEGAEETVTTFGEEREVA